MIRSFRDATTNVLKCYGSVTVNQPGDLVRIEPDDFALTPGQWQWNGTQWIPFVPAPLTAAQHLANDTASKLIQALVIYLGQIQVPAKTPVQVAADLLAIYQGLP